MGFVSRSLIKVSAIDKNRLWSFKFLIYSTVNALEDCHDLTLYEIYVSG